MRDYYQKLVDSTFGDQLPQTERDGFAKAIKDRVQLFYALPLIFMVLYTVAVFATPLLHYVERDLGIPAGIIHVFTIIPIGVGVGFLIYALINQKRYPHAMIEMKLKEMQLRRAHCRDCGYALKGSVSPTCPECGASVA